MQVHVRVDEEQQLLEVQQKDASSSWCFSSSCGSWGYVGIMEEEAETTT